MKEKTWITGLRGPSYFLVDDRGVGQVVLARTQGTGSYSEVYSDLRDRD